MLPWNKDTKFFVIVNHYDADVSWADELIFPHVIYTKNNPSAEPFNAINKAKSESNFCKFISEFYDNLPQNIIIVHQYNIKPFSHEGSIVDILNDPLFEKKYSESKTKGFWNFNSFIQGSMRQNVPRMLKSGWWKNTMAPFFGDIRQYDDFGSTRKGCAQFVVSRERIHSLPRKFYSNMYKWLVQNSIGVDSGIDPSNKTRQATPIDNHPNSNYHTSRYLEWTWELIFITYKESEVLNYEINGVKLLALYGKKKYYIDVTERVMQHFIKNKHIIIDPEINFNLIFDDIIHGTVKELKLKVGKNTIIVPENRSDKIIIPIS